MNTDKIYAERIASEYAPKEASKITALRKLDNKAKLPAEIFTYTFGIISALIFGTAMCLCIKVDNLSVYKIVIYGKEKGKGCKASVFTGIPVILSLALVGLAMIKRKKGE